MARAFGESSGVAKVKVRKFSGMELTVLRHLINSCSVPGWTGTKKRHTTMNVDAIHTDNCTAFHATTMAVRAAGAGAYDAAEKTANGQDNLRLTGAWSDLTAFRHACPNAVQQISPAIAPHRSARRQSLRPQSASPPRADANAIANCPARQRPSAKHGRSRRRAGFPVSLALQRGKTTLPAVILAAPSQVHQKKEGSQRLTS